MNIFMENLCYFTILLQNIFKIAILLEKKTHIVWIRLNLINISKMKYLYHCHIGNFECTE